MRRAAPGRRLAAGLVLAAALGVFGSTSPAAAADPALEAQIDKLSQSLGEPDGPARAKAMKEIAALGKDAVPVLLDRLPKDTKSRRFAGMLEAVAEIDLEGAIGLVESTRTEWKAAGWTAPADGSKEPTARDATLRDATPYRRVVDAILEGLRDLRQPSQKRSVALTPSQLNESFVVPPWVAVPLDAKVSKTLPEALAGAPYNWREKDGVLEIDSRKSGSYATKVAPGESQVVELGSRKPFRKLVVWKRLGRWFVAPASTWTGGLDALFAEFLDADLDGDVTGGADLVRFGGGAFRKVSESDLAWSPAGLVRWKVRKDGTGSNAQFVVDFTREPQAPWMNEIQPRMMDTLNSWRQALGMPPQWPDRARSSACREHHEFWVANGFSGHDQVKGAPKASATGARAGQASSVTNSPDGPDFVRDISWTLLHRNSCVAHASEGVGAWSGEAGGLLWGGGHDARDRGFPILVPGPGMDGVPTLCEPEIPVPDKNPDFYKTQRGAPLSVSWPRLGPAWEDLKRLRIELYAIPEATGDDGSAAPPAPVGPLPGTTYSKEYRYKEDFAAGFPEATVFFVTDAPLEKGTHYVARFKADGKDGKPESAVEFEWEFRTEE